MLYSIIAYYSPHLPNDLVTFKVKVRSERNAEICKQSRLLSLFNGVIAKK